MSSMRASSMDTLYASHAALGNSFLELAESHRKLDMLSATSGLVDISVHAHKSHRNSGLTSSLFLFDLPESYPAPTGLNAVSCQSLFEKVSER